ncbi:peroxiredoxin family protein [Neisseria sp. Ec49-e6-T10]|uniref:peroxiredoxin family protein n=1 Tax=Neisseria sp. Ec49-e6-T10 TaxID=3140744 RepID=UPI003EBDB7B4
MRNKKWLFPLILLVIVCFGAAALFFNQKKAPDFALTSLEGQNITQSQLQGKVTLVNFWATTCSGCIKEMPMLKATHQKFAPQGYQTLAVAMSYDPENQVRNFTQQNQLPFLVAIDKDNSVADAFGGIQLTPTSILVGKNGNIIKTFVGEPDEQLLHQLIESAIKAS